MTTTHSVEAASPPTQAPEPRTQSWRIPPGPLVLTYAGGGNGTLALDTGAPYRDPIPYGEVVFHADRDMHVIVWNDEACQMLGRSTRVDLDWPIRRTMVNWTLEDKRREFKFGDMRLRQHTATDPSTRETVTYVHRVDVDPPVLVALTGRSGMHLQRDFRNLDPDALERELARAATLKAA